MWSIAPMEICIRDWLINAFSSTNIRKLSDWKWTGWFSPDALLSWLNKPVYFLKKKTIWINNFKIDILRTHCLLSWGVGFRGGGKAEFVHHPIGFGSFTGWTKVVNQRFLETDALEIRVNRFIDTGSFPETWTGDPVWSNAIPVFPASHAEEVPLLFSHS